MVRRRPSPKSLLRLDRIDVSACYPQSIPCETSASEQPFAHLPRLLISEPPPQGQCSRSIPSTLCWLHSKLVRPLNSPPRSCGVDQCSETRHFAVKPSSLRLCLTFAPLWAFTRRINAPIRFHRSSPPLRSARSLFAPRQPFVLMNGCRIIVPSSLRFARLAVPFNLLELGSK